MHVVLDGPRTLNSQTPDTWAALQTAAEDLPSDTRVVVLRGAGRAFSSGLDRSTMPVLAGMSALGDAEVQARIAGYQGAFTCWRRPGVLSVAAVGGPAVGAGFQLALACDLRVAADTATFRMAETSLGLVPDLAGTAPLVRAVGEAAAVEICLTGRTVSAQEALRRGLVVAVVPADELEQTTDDLVEAVLASPPASTAETLDLLRDAGARPTAEQLARERSAQSRLLRRGVSGGRGRPSAGRSGTDRAEGTGPGGR